MSSSTMQSGALEVLSDAAWVADINPPLNTWQSPQALKPYESSVLCSYSVFGFLYLKGSRTL